MPTSTVIRIISDANTERCFIGVNPPVQELPEDITGGEISERDGQREQKFPTPDASLTVRGIAAAVIAEGGQPIIMSEHTS